MDSQTLPVGALLRQWRQRRRLSQLDLACDADISTRHLSFVETGRALPSREMLLQSERALARIADGTYGVCESCGNPIGKLRLQVFPRATLCVTCKQRQERR